MPDITDKNLKSLLRDLVHLTSLPRVLAILTDLVEGQATDEPPDSARANALWATASHLESAAQEVS